MSLLLESMVKSIAHITSLMGSSWLASLCGFLISVLLIFALVDINNISTFKHGLIKNTFKHLAKIIKYSISCMASLWLALKRFFFPVAIFDEASVTLTFSSNTKYITSNMVKPYHKIVANVVVPDSVISIGDKAFYQCSALTSIKIPNSVISIGQSAFDGCTCLSSMTLPSSLVCMGSHAFTDCSKLTSISIPPNVRELSEGVFKNCSALKSVTLNHELIFIKESAFEYCRALQSITFNNRLIMINEKAFAFCSSLTLIRILGNTLISVKSFAHSALTTIEIFKKLDTLNWHTAFADCKSIKNLFVPDPEEFRKKYFLEGIDIKQISMTYAVATHHTTLPTNNPEPFRTSDQFPVDKSLHAAKIPAADPPITPINDHLHNSASR